MTGNLPPVRDIWHRLTVSGNRVAGTRPPQGALFWVLAGAVPLSVIVSTHVWLRTAYSGGTFHLQGFLAQYDYGIYRYRLLGRDAVLLIYRNLLHLFHDQPLAMPRDPDATLLFYASYVTLNALCFSVSNFLLLLLLSDSERRLSDLRLAVYLYLAFIQTLAMAVVNPYDQLAYLLILVSFFAATIRRNWLAYLVLGVAAIAGTLTRETQFLVTPALFSVGIFSSANRSRRYWTAGSLNLALFTLVYIALRLSLPGKEIVAAGWTYGGKWAIESAIVLALLFFIGTSLALRMRSDIRPTFMLLAFSTPYIVTILVSGILREMRLLVPVLLAQAFVYVELGTVPGAVATHNAGSKPSGGRDCAD